MRMKMILLQYREGIVFAVFSVLVFAAALSLVSGMGFHSGRELSSRDGVDLRGPFYRLEARLLGPHGIVASDVTVTSGALSYSARKGRLCQNCGRVVSRDMRICAGCGWPGLRADTQGPLEFRVAEISEESVNVLFMGYMVKAGGDPEKPDGRFWTIKLAWDGQPEILPIPLGGEFHGYRIGPLEKRTEKVWSARREAFVEREHWVLAIKKSGHDTVELRSGDSARVKDIYTILEIDSGADKGKNTRKLYDGDTFTANSRTYSVVSVTAEEVVICTSVDDTGEFDR